jgi:hypothetical protein
MAVETHCKLRKAGDSMVENNRLPDTPWHVGYAKKQEDDPRRHKARCIHYRDGQCGWKANYSGKCIGSSHCIDYSESLEDFKKLQESRKTAEQIERDNIDKYRKNMINKIELYSLLMKIKYSDNREKIIDETLKVTRFLLTNVMDVKEESLKEIDECFSK